VATFPAANAICGSIRQVLSSAGTTEWQSTLTRRQTGPGDRSHVIAMTLWEDEGSLWAIEKIADAFADRIAYAAGNAVTRNTYRVLGSIGIAPSKDRLSE